MSASASVRASSPASVSASALASVSASASKNDQKLTQSTIKQQTVAKPSAAKPPLASSLPVAKSGTESAKAVKPSSAPTTSTLKPVAPATKSVAVAAAKPAKVAAVPTSVINGATVGAVETSKGAATSKKENPKGVLTSTNGENPKAAPNGSVETASTPVVAGKKTEKEASAVLKLIAKIDDGESSNAAAEADGEDAEKVSTVGSVQHIIVNSKKLMMQWITAVGKVKKMVPIHASLTLAVMFDTALPQYELMCAFRTGFLARRASTVQYGQMVKVYGQMRYDARAALGYELFAESIEFIDDGLAGDGPGPGGPLGPPHRMMGPGPGPPPLGPPGAPMHGPPPRMGAPPPNPMMGWGGGGGPGPGPGPGPPMRVRGGPPMGPPHSGAPPRWIDEICDHFQQTAGCPNPQCRCIHIVVERYVPPPVRVFIANLPISMNGARLTEILKASFSNCENATPYFEDNADGTTQCNGTGVATFSDWKGAQNALNVRNFHFDEVLPPMEFRLEGSMKAAARKVFVGRGGRFPQVNRGRKNDPFAMTQYPPPSQQPPHPPQHSAPPPPGAVGIGSGSGGDGEQIVASGQPQRPPDMTGALRGAGWRGPPLSAPSVPSPAGNGVTPKAMASPASTPANTSSSKTSDTTSAGKPPGIKSVGATTPNSEKPATTPAASSATSTPKATNHPINTPAPAALQPPPPVVPRPTASATPTAAAQQQQRPPPSRLAAAMISAPPRPFRLTRPGGGNAMTAATPLVPNQLALHRSKERIYEQRIAELNKTILNNQATIRILKHNPQSKSVVTEKEAIIRSQKQIIDQKEKEVEHLTKINSELSAIVAADKEESKDKKDVKREGKSKDDKVSFKMKGDKEKKKLDDSYVTKGGKMYGMDGRQLCAVFYVKKYCSRGNACMYSHQPPCLIETVLRLGAQRAVKVREKYLKSLALPSTVAETDVDTTKSTESSSCAPDPFALRVTTLTEARDKIEELQQKLEKEQALSQTYYRERYRINLLYLDIQKRYGKLDTDYKRERDLAKKRGAEIERLMKDHLAKLSTDKDGKGDAGDKVAPGKAAASERDRRSKSRGRGGGGKDSKSAKSRSPHRSARKRRRSRSRSRSAARRSSSRRGGVRSRDRGDRPLDSRTRDRRSATPRSSPPKAPHRRDRDRHGGRDRDSGGRRHSRSPKRPTPTVNPTKRHAVPVASSGRRKRSRSRSHERTRNLPRAPSFSDGSPKASSPFRSDRTGEVAQTVSSKAYSRNENIAEHAAGRPAHKKPRVAGAQDAMRDEYALFSAAIKSGADGDALPAHQPQHGPPARQLSALSNPERFRSTSNSPRTEPSRALSESEKYRTSVEQERLRYSSQHHQISSPQVYDAHQRSHSDARQQPLPLPQRPFDDDALSNTTTPEASPIVPQKTRSRVAEMEGQVSQRLMSKYDMRAPAQSSGGAPSHSTYSLEPAGTAPSQADYTFAKVDTSAAGLSGGYETQQPPAAASSRYASQQQQPVAAFAGYGTSHQPAPVSAYHTQHQGGAAPSAAAHQMASSQPPAATAGAEDVGAQEEDGDGDEVEAILDSDVRDGELFYKLKWVGYPPTEQDWVPASHLQDAHELINEYNDRMLQAAQ